MPVRPVPLGALVLGLDLEQVTGRGDLRIEPHDTVTVVEWRPERRDGPLPDLVRPVAAALADEPAVVVVLCPGRRVNPPEAVVAAAARQDVPLLWGGPDVQSDAVRARLAGLRGEGESEGAAEPAPAHARLLETLVDGADLPGLVARIAGLLGAHVSVVDGRRVVAAEPPEPDPTLPEVLALPLEHARRHVGTLRIARDEPLDPGEAAALTALGHVVALAVRVHAVDAVEDALAPDLLTAILGDDLVAREAALRRSRRLQAFPQRSAVVVAVEPFDAPLSRAGMTRLARQFELAVHAEDDRAVMAVHEGSIVLLVGADVIMARLLRTMRRRAALPLVAGTSGAVDDSRSFPGAYRQAQRAATIGRRLGRANQVTDYDQLGVLRLLYQLPEHERRAFVQETLGPLATAELPDAAMLRSVIHALRATHGNISESARRLFIHPNTLRQRVHRIETLIGPFLADPDRRLTVFVALDLHLLDDGTER
ncbi:PucR family transcriptional regulator [Nocardioides zeae]|uniref:PucR family transcriptional regulator n=1 Tax=Nocardioides zeae TaxID=1457234 RepID=A0AAJ1X2I7_9ACTN|nr:helix-turn-helix domain-containing protein [Nocardioides zeae]MDQ1103612.1 hypothetical protein [Nocardioides zeae]